MLWQQRLLQLICRAPTTCTKAAQRISWAMNPPAPGLAAHCLPYAKGSLNGDNLKSHRTFQILILSHSSLSPGSRLWFLVRTHSSLCYDSWVLRAEETNKITQSDLLYSADHTFHPPSSTNQSCEAVLYLLHGKGVRVIVLAIENLCSATQHCTESSPPALPLVLVSSDNKIWLLSTW